MQRQKDFIEEIPAIDSEIKQACEKGKLVIFTGAGASRIMGCASWDSLAYSLIDACFNSYIINFSQKMHISNLRDNKKIITICKKLLEENDKKNLFNQCMSKALTGDKNKQEDRNLYKYLAKLGAIYVTTNADTLFDNYFSKENIYAKDQVDEFSISTNSLYHIHGMLEKDDIVFTAQEYLELYQENSRFLRFLRKVLSREYTVLFIGYGLSEFELLDYIVTKLKKDNKNTELSKFTLSNYKPNENDLVEIDQLYFDDLGIQIIPYNYEEKGYDQLFDIIKSWSEELINTSDYSAGLVKQLKKTIFDFNLETARPLLRHMNSEPFLQNEFFKLIPESPNPYEWFTLLNEFGYFNLAEENIKPVITGDGFQRTPLWQPINYLELVASKERNKHTILSELDKVLENIISTLSEIETYNYRIIDRYISIIGYYPIELIEEKHITYICNFIETEWLAANLFYNLNKELLPKLIKEKFDSAFKIIRILLGYKIKENDNNVFTDKLLTHLPELELEELMSSIRANIQSSDYVSIINHIIDIIITLESTKATHLNSIWIPTIEDHEQTSFTEKYEIQIVRLLRDMLELSSAEDIRPTVVNMFNKKRSILRRIAIHIINKHYDELNDLFWSYTHNPLEEILDTHELYELLNSHTDDFDEQQTKQIIDWIESKDYSWTEEDDYTPEIIEMRKAYAKKVWLSSIMKSKFSIVKNTYNKYHRINDTEPEHPGFLSYSYGVEWTSPYNQSPFNEDQILIMPNDDIVVEMLKPFEKDKYGDSPKEGFAWIIRACVSKEPKKFYNDLDKFTDVDYAFISSILEGLYIAAKDELTLNWSKIFDYINNIIKKLALFKSKHRESILRNIAYIITKGSTSESYGFDESLLDDATKIILALHTTLEPTEAEDYKNSDDLLNIIINDERYPYYEAMIILSLKEKRINKTDWDSKIKAIFAESITSNYLPAVFFVIGKFIRNIHYINENWLIKNFKLIYNKDNTVNWTAAMMGYLFNSQASREIYKMLKENGDIHKSLEISFDNRLENRQVQHIAIAYMNDEEQIGVENSAIDYIFELSNKKQITELISFIARLDWKEADTTKKAEKLLRELYKKYASNLSLGVIFADAIKLYKYIENVEEFTDLYSLGIKNMIQIRCNNIVDLIAFSEKHYNNYSQIILDILFEVSKNQLTIDRDDDKIQKILTKMHDLDLNKSDIRRVCNSFIRNERLGYMKLLDKFSDDNRDNDF